MATWSGDETNRAIQFPSTLRSLISQAGFERNRKAVAESIHISTSALSQYMSGKSKPSLETLLALANFFNVSLDYLVYGESTTTATPVDYGPLSKYLDLSLSKVQADASKHNAVLNKLGFIISRQIDELAKDLSDTGTLFSGQLADDEILIVEKFSDATYLLSTNLAYDISAYPEQDAVIGRFLPTVAANLAANRPYQILVPEAVDNILEIVETFRNALAKLTPPESIFKNLTIRSVNLPVCTGLCIYELDIKSLEEEHPLLHETISGFVFNNKLACTIAPSQDLQAGALLDELHHNLALNAFGNLWDESSPI